jgi:hypothetical protein
MAGLLLKDHDRPTIGDAAIVTTHGPGPLVCSSICCNAAVGGLNVTAVESALDLGVAMVFLPTSSAENDRRFWGADGEPPQDGEDEPLLATGDEAVTSQVRAILAAAATVGVPVATGHLSAQEVSAVVAAGADLGSQIVVTHAPVFTGSELNELAGWVAAGATLELAAAFCCGGPDLPSRVVRSADADAAIIEAVGADSVVLSSDLGFARGPEPVEGFARYLGELLAVGVPEAALRQMTSDNPRRLIAVPAEGSDVG